jgi:hypothetical protein
MRKRRQPVADSREDQQLAGRLVAVAALGLVMIVPPLLAHFDRPERVLGVPVLWAYLYLVWAFLVALIALIVFIGGRSR